MIRHVAGSLAVVGFLLSLSTVDAQTFSSSNLPIIIITTDNGASIPDEPKISATMGIINRPGGARNNVSDPFNDYNGKIGIELRGSTSQSFPKKQYGIELKTDAGADRSASLLGMPPEEDWVLFGPYNDKSLMRDVLTYQIGRSLGRVYAPRTRYCEVIINNNYQGVYALIEKIKRDENRVNISRLRPEDNAGVELTGGYILKVDKSEGNSGAGFDSKIPPSPNPRSQVITFQYEYPKYNEITGAQKTYIQNYINSFEAALNGSNFTDLQTGYDKYINVDSFVDYLIMTELTRNVDGYRISTFLYKQKDTEGGKLVMGPIWDYNLAFGNADYCSGGSTSGFAYDFNNICNGDVWLVPFWWRRLMQDPSFRNRLGGRWETLRAGPLSTDRIHARIDSIANLLNESQTRNFQRWPVLGRYVWPNFFVGQTYRIEVDWLKNWIAMRTIWLDNNFPKFDPTAVEEPGTGFRFYPNPGKGTFWLEWNALGATPADVAVYAASGQLLKKFRLSIEQPTALDLSELNPGLYLLRTVCEGKVATQKFIIQP
jgi:hypothetical protein